MGLGRTLNRAINYQVTNTVSGESQTFTIIDTNPLAPSWSTAGDYRGALSIPGVRRSAGILCDLIGSFPWHAYRGDDRIDPTPSLLLQPNPLELRSDTISSMLLDYLMDGNSISVIAERNAEAYPSAIIPVPASSVAVAVEEGVKVYRIGDRKYSATDIIHVKALSAPGSLRGKGVLEYHCDTIDLAREQLRQARNVSTSGVPTGTLKSDNPDLTQEEANDLKASWLRAQRDRTVAVLNATTNFQAVSWNPTETQLLEARKFSLHDIALMFGLPLSFLGADTNSRTYSNIEQEGLNLVKFTLLGHLTKFEQAFSSCFPYGTDVKANTDSLLRADTLSRYQAHAIAIDKGFLSVDEVRALENRKPLPTPEPTPSPDPEDIPEENAA